MRLGVVSATTREIHSTSSDVILGVGLEKGEGGEVIISDVSADSGAENAGLKKGDLFLTAEGIEVDEVNDIFDAVAGRKIGEFIQVKILRGEEEMLFDVELMARPGDGPTLTRNDGMSGVESISERRDGFARVIHHDTPLSKSSVGGPLLDLEGACIGMNIARASRVATFAIPARELQVIMGEMIPNPELGSE